MKRSVDLIRADEPDTPSYRLNAACRSAALALAILTPALWLFPICYALYAMLLLDVARPGRSGETVIGLLGITLVLIVLHGLLLGRRRQILGHLAALLDRLVPAAPHVDIDPVRMTLLGGGAAVLINVTALPLLFVMLVAIIGVVAAIPLAGALVSGSLLAAAWRPARRLRDAADAARQARETNTATSAPKRELLALLGMEGHARALHEMRQHAVAVTEAAAGWQATDVRARLSLIAGFTITATAGATAWLMASDEASMGTLVAALLLALFMLAPLVRLGDHLDTLGLAGASWQAFRDALASVEPPRPLIALPPPVRRVEATGIAVPIHGTRRMMLQDVSFAAEAGDIVAVIGPADVGKSTLLKLLAGQVPAAAGIVRLDGAALAQWTDAERAQHIGYLPQLPELLPGTVAQNIARFQPQTDSAAITRAALAAGAHEAIVRLPAGYDTQIGAADAPPLALSVQQRIALARALFGDPFLLLLDHPSAFQDNEGHAALRQTLAGLRARGAVTVVVGDSAAIIDSANLVLMLRKGGMADFGTKEEVRARLAERQRRDAERLAAVSVCADPRGKDAQ